MGKRKSKKTSNFGCQAELGDEQTQPFTFTSERNGNSWAVQAIICPLFTCVPLRGMGLRQCSGTLTTSFQFESSEVADRLQRKRLGIISQPAVVLDRLTPPAVPAFSNSSSADTVSKLSSSGSVISNKSSQKSVTSVEKRSKCRKSREISPLPIVELKKKRTRGKSVDNLKVDSPTDETKKSSRRKSRDVTPAAERKSDSKSTRLSVDKKMAVPDTPSRKRHEKRSSSRSRDREVSVDSMKKAETTKDIKKENGGRSSSKSGSSSRSCERDVDTPRKRASTTPAKRENDGGNSSKENPGSRKRERSVASSKKDERKKAKVVNTAEPVITERSKFIAQLASLPLIAKQLSEEKQAQRVRSRKITRRRTKSKEEKCEPIQTDIEKHRKLAISVDRLKGDVIASFCKMIPIPCTSTAGINAEDVEVIGPRTDSEKQCTSTPRGETDKRTKPGKWFDDESDAEGQDSAVPEECDEIVNNEVDAIENASLVENKAQKGKKSFEEVSASSEAKKARSPSPSSSKSPRRWKANVLPRSLSPDAGNSDKSASNKDGLDSSGKHGKEINEDGCEEDREAVAVSSSCGNTKMPSTKSVDDEEEAVVVSSSVLDISDENQMSAVDNSRPATPASDALVEQVEEPVTSPDGSAKKSERSCIDDSVGDIGGSTRSNSGSVEVRLSSEEASSSRSISPIFVVEGPNRRNSTSAVSSRAQLNDGVSKRRRSCGVRKAEPEDDVQVTETIINVNLGKQQPKLRIREETLDCHIGLMNRLLDATQSDESDAEPSEIVSVEVLREGEASANSSGADPAFVEYSRDPLSD